MNPTFYWFCLQQHRGKFISSHTCLLFVCLWKANGKIENDLIFHHLPGFLYGLSFQICMKCHICKSCLPLKHNLLVVLLNAEKSTLKKPQKQKNQGVTKIDFKGWNRFQGWTVFSNPSPPLHLCSAACRFFLQALIDFQHWTAPVAWMNRTHVTAAAVYKLLRHNFCLHCRSHWSCFPRNDKMSKPGNAIFLPLKNNLKQE